MAKAPGGAIRAGSAFVELFVENSMGKELKSALRQFSEFGEQVRKVGVIMAGLSSLTLAPVVASLKSVSSALKDLPSILDGVERLKVGFRAEDASGILAAVDLFEDLEAASQGLTTAIASALAPAVQDLRALIMPFVQNLIEWIRNNGEIILTAAKVAAGIAAIGVAMAVLGPAINLAVASMSAFATLLSVLTNPITLVAGGIFALGYAFVKFTETGKAVAAWFGERFSEVMGIAREAIGGLADALMAGDLILAAKIAWTGLQLVFKTGVLELKKTWGEWKLSFLDYLDQAVAGAKLYLVDLTADFKTGFATLEFAYRDLWQSFTKFMGLALVNAIYELQQWILTAERSLKLFSLKVLYTANFMSKSKYDAQVEGIRQTWDRTSSGIENSRKAKANKIESKYSRDYNTELENRILEILGGRDTQRSSIVNTTEMKKGQRRDAMNFGAEEAELDALRSQLTDLIEQARVARADKQKPGVDIDGVRKQLAERAYTTIGTFNGSVGSRLGFGGGADRQTRASEQTAENTRRILERMSRNGGLVWE